MRNVSRRRQARAPAARVYRVGAVSFLNARPLVYGLNRNRRVRLTLDVPSALGEGLDSGRLDIALVPAIDCQRAGRRWTIVPAGCIASDRETLTVRIFSRVPIERIERLTLDADSHTSAVLAPLLLRRRFGLSPQLVGAQMQSLLSRPPAGQPDSILLIGDKVVQAGPNDPDSPWPYQLDLGAAWRAWTGLPFVFAVWAAPAGADLGDLPELLARAKAAGLTRRDRIARTDGPALGWPAGLAHVYMTRHLQYDLTPRRRAGLERFFELAAAEALLQRSAADHGPVAITFANEGTPLWHA